MGTLTWEHDDEAGESPLGKPAFLEFELTYCYSPGEKMVRYYSDGSGYPGSPPEVEFDSLCVAIDGNRDVSYDLKKSLGDWFTEKFADCERIFEAVCEHEAEVNEDYDRD